MSLSNTEAFAFTQLPSVITKRWTRCSVAPETLHECEISSTHRSSMINSIELVMDFDDLSDWYRTNCTAADDKDEDAILTWREHRQLWTDIENAVSNTVDAYIKDIRERSRVMKNRSFDAPVLTRTKIVPRTTSVNPASASNKRHSRTNSSSRSTASLRTGIRPNDSASAVVFDMSEIQSIIQREIRSRESDKCKSAHKKKKHGSKSMSLLSYAAGQR